MDDSSLPVKRILRPYFPPGHGSSEPPTEKVKIKKQKLLSSYGSIQAPTPIQPTQQQLSTLLSTSTTKETPNKFFDIFQPAKAKSTASKTTVDQEEKVKPASAPPKSIDNDATSSPFAIIRSMNKIRVSDPASIPPPRKASIWTQPSRSAPQLLPPIKATPSDDEEEKDDYTYFHQPIMTTRKHQLMVPWPDKTVFKGGHIKQATTHDAYPPSSFNVKVNKRSCPLQHIVQTQGETYLLSLRQKRLERQQHESMFSDLHISQLQEEEEEYPCDIESMMDTLYPLDQGGWRYPACEGLLNRKELDTSLPWCEKYRPCQVEHLLDNQSHHRYLRDWLERQKVPSTKTDVSFFAPRKKKVTQRDMEQHYTDTNDEDDEDDDFVPTKTTKKKKKRKSKKDLNMILLVGPHGVGKTAGVYTAAQETGYQVFEIYPGIKRSYKDVMRLVGDMTKNHLVRFHSHKAFPPKKDDDDSNNNDNNDEEEEEDDADMERTSSKTPITTSRPNQLLTHFFTSKKTTSSPLSDTTASSSTTTSPSTTNDLVEMDTTHDEQMSSEPKQSLILLEEVDLVYQSDKGFWTAVAELARTSKRPIIMTCNDTLAIPFDMLQLQAIVYYESPLVQMLLPFLHLICLLERYTISVADLMDYIRSIGPDIRQLLTTLEYAHYYHINRYNDDKKDKRLHNPIVEAHVNLLMDQLQQDEDIFMLRYISDHIPGAQVTPLCNQWLQRNRNKTMIISDDDDPLKLLETWMNNRSLIDYGIGMTEQRQDQVYGIDEYDMNDDQQCGYLHFQKKPDAWDHWEMEANLEMTLLEWNQLEQGTGLLDIMGWEIICQQRNKQKQQDLEYVSSILNCRWVTILDILFAKTIETNRRHHGRLKRRRLIRSRN
ncbi:uncharacterized protein BX664DRAFT_202573 [Halteromyces radiatus]|uniref:uncharacterized protein n=1 Tax=Halteromyces radiatus TaxID=101107 RepID=UPI00221F449A|nr:uncharacterized protein BX664DRAFT_202573 [Halteromyces radiatus]KAI8079799.1 hypothetical protein BX664DRAFT_202573 [Halteromyces radiatus]